MSRDRPTLAVNGSAVMGETCMGRDHCGLLMLEQTRYIWEAKWWTNKAPYHYSLGDWFESEAPFVCSPDGGW